jgi:hypothetical protein
MVFQPAMIGVRRRSWRPTRRAYPSCQEPGPHSSDNCMSYEQPQLISAATGRPVKPLVTYPNASFPGAILTIVSTRRLDSRRSWWNYCRCKHLAR